MKVIIRSVDLNGPKVYSKQKKSPKVYGKAFFTIHLGAFFITDKNIMMVYSKAFFEGV